MLIASVCGNTDTGRIRANNEDAYIAQTIWDANHWLLVVIDGLGGYAGGEVAASIARTTIINSMKKYYGIDCLDAIMQSVADANNAIFNQRNSKDELHEMGCVITAAVLDLGNRQLSVAHVGDTRLYQYDKNGLQKITHDHSFVGRLEDDGRISEEDAMRHPRRNLIDRIVGDKIRNSETPNFIEGAVFPVEKDVQYLLCSDGLSDMLTSANILSVLQKKTSVKNKVQQLINNANKQGGKDNITAVVVSVGIGKVNTVLTKKKSYKTKPKGLTNKKSQKKRLHKTNANTGHDISNNPTESNQKLYVIVVMVLGLLVCLIYLFYKYFPL